MVTKPLKKDWRKIERKSLLVALREHRAPKVIGWGREEEQTRPVLDFAARIVASGMAPDVSFALALMKRCERK